MKCFPADSPSCLPTCFDYSNRFEIRFQSDVYQDLLPSQLATLVEHLHASDNVKKADIARYIGVSPATLRNYTGLARLLARGGLCVSVVRLMDAGVLPSSNPYAWLRLTDEGVSEVLRTFFSEGEAPEVWAEALIGSSERPSTTRYTTGYVEGATSAMADVYYKRDGETRAAKRTFGHRKGRGRNHGRPTHVPAAVTSNLVAVRAQSESPVLRTAARALTEYLTDV